jgi:hypothetical protein
MCSLVAEKYIVQNSGGGSTATVVAVNEDRSVSPAAFTPAPVIVQAAYTNYRLVYSETDGPIE